MSIRKAVLSLSLLSLIFTGDVLADEYSTVTGIIEPVRDLDLSMSVDGVVLELMVTEGAKVKAGDALLRLDDRLEAFEVKRRRLMRDNTGGLEASRQKKKIIQAMLESSRQLYQMSGAVSAEQVQQIEITYHDIVGAIRSLENEKSREQVEFDLAQAQLDRRTLKAPISGVIALVKTDVGERVRAEEPVIRIVDLSSCYLIINVEESHAGQLQLGSEQTVEVKVGEAWLARQAEVVFVSPVADAASGLVRIKLQLGNPAGDIRPGMPGRLAFSQ